MRGVGVSEVSFRGVGVSGSRCRVLGLSAFEFRGSGVRGLGFRVWDDKFLDFSRIPIFKIFFRQGGQN